MHFWAALVVALMAAGSASGSCVEITPWTEYDKPLEYHCPPNMHLKRIESVHDNWYEDRIWRFTCDTYPGDGDTEVCWWGDYMNAFDKEFDYTCPGEAIAAGMFSIHDSWYEDRRFKFYCCKVKGMKAANCHRPEEAANLLDQRLDFLLPKGKVIAGLWSWHSWDTEDRLFSFKTCDLVPR